MPDDHEKIRRDWHIPDPLWERIEPLLPARKPHPLGCHRPRVDDRKAMDAILFVLRTGCQWNALNETGICSSSSAHRRFQEWVEADVFVALWEQGLVDYDALQGIDWEWLAMDGANRNDFKMARATIESIAVERPDPTPDTPQGMCLDKGYDYDEVRDLLEEFGFTAHICARGEEAKALKQEVGFKARRWVVERTHSWMNRFRRVLIRWDKKACNYLGFLHLACAYITYRQAGLLR